MGACREMRLPRSESESQSMSPSAALDSLAAAAAPAPATPAAGQSSSTSTEDRCFAGFALSGVKSYAGGSSCVVVVWFRVVCYGLRRVIDDRVILVDDRGIVEVSPDSTTVLSPAQ